MNKYILKILLAIVLAVLALSCTKEGPSIKLRKEETPINNSKSKYSFIVSAGRGQTKAEEPDTRAFMDMNDYLYWWEPEDKIIMSITHVDQPSNTITDLEHMELSAMNPDNVLHTTFLADLVQEQYQNLMDAGADNFDYYSFFPFNINGYNSLTTSFPASLQFTMPDSYSNIIPNTFPDEKYAPMVAVVKNKAPEIFYSEDTDDPVYQLGGLHFDYEHILSYAAIEMDVKLLPEAVTSITMTVGSVLNNDTRINGTFVYNPSAGTYTLSGGSNSVTITNISNGGLVAGSGQAIYIPMPVKDLSGQTLTFTFTTASGSNAYRPLTTSASGVNFERGKIHRIRIAPAAQYAAGTQFTTTKAGYYYIEAWGGNGGTGSNTNGGRTGGSGGNGATIHGIYHISTGETISIQVGKAGENGSGVNTYGTGGSTLGTNYGLGKGGDGGVGHTAGYSSNAGAGGGAASGVLRNGSAILVAGGGGGGGGASAGNTSINPSNGGNGGSGGTNGEGSVGGSPSNSGRDGKGGKGNGEGGANGGGGTNGSTTLGVDGGSGGDGRNGSWPYTSGSGGGGGGGGYINGGGGGGGGNRGGTGTGNASGAGGGGAGGSSYITGTHTDDHGKTLPTGNTRPGNNGYVIITFLR